MYMNWYFEDVSSVKNILQKGLTVLTCFHWMIGKDMGIYDWENVSFIDIYGQITSIRTGLKFEVLLSPSALVLPTTTSVESVSHIRTCVFSVSLWTTYSSSSFHESHPSASVKKMSEWDFY